MRDNKELTVSDLIDISRLKLDQFNLIVAGCGTGKSYFAIKELISKVNNQFKQNIEGYEVWFVTSRKITKEQQLNDEKYKAGLKKLNEWQCELLINSKNIKKDIIKLGKEFKSKIAIMTYNQFNICINDKLDDKLKIIVFDESHALISDRNYITEMNNVKDFIRNTLSKKSNKKYLIGMTATDHLLKRKIFDIKINYLLDEPFFKYKVSKVYTNSLIFFDYILDNLTGKTILMIDNVKEIIKIKDKYKEKCMIAISDTKSLDKTYTKEYKGISKQDKNYIIQNKTLRDDVDLFVSTSCSREGFEFESDKIKIDNVIVCSQFATDIIQFAGRYRGNIENLYIFNKPFYDENKLNIIENKQNKNFYDYIYKSRNYYFDDFKMLDDMVVYSKLSQRIASIEFKKYINENWTNKIIFNTDQREEIKKHATYLGLRKEGNKYTWNDIINSTLVDIIYEKDKVRTTDERLKKCTNYDDVKEKKQISCTIFKKTRVRSR